mmetsp:Transcript_10440/g.11926  ORF Transcript_10440/g.11926 Transcript_10440/m.11926 type:complete len:528 (+) Transcript_10440:159-1742(+)
MNPLKKVKLMSTVKQFPRSINADVAIIGGGTAGLSAYRTAKKRTSSVVMIEGGPYGTTCARVGCMPSKLLIAAAESAMHVRKAPEFGVHVGPEGKTEGGATKLARININGRQVMNRVKYERDRFVGFVLDAVEKIPNEDKIGGYAKFLDNDTLAVDDHTIIKAKGIVIATGSRPSYPASWKKELGDLLLVNDDIFDWDELPEAVAVVGVGIIGLELGQALHRLGVKVKLFGRGGAIGPCTDPKVLAYCGNIFKKELFLEADVNLESMKRMNIDGKDKVKIEYNILSSSNGGLSSNSSDTLIVDYVLAATGRIPNLDHIGLENTTVTLDELGVPIADGYTLQTSCKNIFLAGDASNKIPLLHEATDEGRIAGDNAGGYPDVRAGFRRSPIAIVFTDPQIAMVGESYKQLNTRQDSADRFAIGEASFENQGRSRVLLRNQGILRVYGEQGSGLFLGAEMIGPDAEHLAHLLAWAHQSKMTVSQMLDMPFYHPVIEEGVRTALRNLNAKLRIDPGTPKGKQGCFKDGPGR